MQEDLSQHKDDNTEYSKDVDLKPLGGRQRNDESSNDNSDGSYIYHTDNNDSTFESSDDEYSNSKLSQHQCSGHCSDAIPQSIDTYSCAPSWTNDTADGDKVKYDVDEDVDDESIVPLRLRGGGIPVVETVTDDDMEEGDDDQPQPQSQPT